MSQLSENSDYIHFLQTVKSEIRSARTQAAKSVNRELILLYWKIGEAIVEKQEKLGWGKSVVERLSRDIRQDFDGIKGFSADNLWRMRQFYLEYSNETILEQAVPELIEARKHNKILEQLVPDLSKNEFKDVKIPMRQLVAKIPWGHNLLIIKKIKNINERLYYILASIECGWSRNVLLNQIKADAYGRHMLSDKQHNFDKALPKHFAEQADETMKDSYMLDFLGITKPVLERELENRMVERIRDVIIEFGQGFAFVGNQYKIRAEHREYYIDLLFYHRKLKCLVAFELKAGKFKPEYAGKMNFYLNLLDDFVREDGEMPSIGIILCAEKDNFEIEYSLRKIDKPVGVAEYQLTNKLPEKFKKALPTAEDIKNKLYRK